MDEAQLFTTIIHRKKTTQNTYVRISYKKSTYNVVRIEKDTEY